jgi:hypothetical protein
MWSRGFELAYATTAGDQIPVPLVAAWSLRLESVPPVRRFGSYRGQRHLVGGGRPPMGGMSDPSRGLNET